MRGKQSSADLDRTDAAFNRVLEAEAQARLVVEECRRRAAEMAATAAEQARRVERRTEAHLLLVHRRADASVARALAGLQVQGVGLGAEEPDAAVLARLESVVEALADEMIGIPGNRGGVERGVGS